MVKYSKSVVVTDEEWDLCVKTDWQKNLDMWEEEEFEGDKEYEHFFHSGNFEKYIDECISVGRKPVVGLSYIFYCNPNRDFELFINNFIAYWNWVLAIPEDRLPTSNGVDVLDKVDVLEGMIKIVGGVHTPFLDPVCSVKLFKMIYGEIYQKENIFPFSLGPDNWQPTITVDPYFMFSRMLSSIQYYLFEPNCAIGHRQCIELIGYWFSVVPLVQDERLYDTVFYDDSDGDFERRQRQVRCFLANLHNYNVWECEMLVLPHNDPEMEDYIKYKLSTLDMPKNYYKLLDFIHKHKEESLWAEE